MAGVVSLMIGTGVKLVRFATGGFSMLLTIAFVVPKPGATIKYLAK